MEFYLDQIKVKCLNCKKISITELLFGLDLKYKDDFYVFCPICDNSESGSMPMQSFNLLEDYGRREMTKQEVEYYGVENREDDLDDN